jgi:hypothetical protein
VPDKQPKDLTDLGSDDLLLLAFHEFQEKWDKVALDEVVAYL